MISNSVHLQNVSPETQVPGSRHEEPSEKGGFIVVNGPDTNLLGSLVKLGQPGTRNEMQCPMPLRGHVDVQIFSFESRIWNNY